MTNKLTVESVIEELETLASPIAEVMPDATRLTAFILATNKLRTTLTTLQTQHAIDVSESYAQGWNEGQQALGKQHREEVLKVANQIGECLEYCAVQNGIPECKNCGLTLKMYQDLTNPN